MNKSKILLIIFVVIIAVVLWGNRDSKILPASDNLVFKKVSPEDAVNQLLNNDIDVYLGTLSPDDAALLKDSNINIYTAAFSILRT